MSEQAPIKSPEQAPGFSEQGAVELQHEAIDPALAEKQAETMQETARAVIHETASNPQPLALPVDDNPVDNQPLYIDKTVKKLRMKQNLDQVRSQLSPGERVLSRIIHQPAIKAASEVSAKTVSRPSGLLGGGVLACLGSLGYLYLAKHIGFTYNYMVFLVLFVGGFAVGIGLELLVSLLRPKHQE